MKNISIGLFLICASTAMPTFFANEVTLKGGHETVAADHGRPIILIAAGLGVAPQVFRDAFIHVKPAPIGQEPDPEQVRRNKEALLSALSKYGVTNELLDTVSNYYRYPPGRNNVWRSRTSEIEAIIVKNVVTGFKVVNGGSGYTSVPIISVAGHPEVKAVATVVYSKDLSKNGSISKVEIVKKP